MRFKGPYYTQVKILAAKFQNFIEKNDLQAIGDLYVLPLKNHWLTSDPSDYINQISMQVEYK